MPVLYTILGIILFFVIIFSIRLGVTVDYGEKTVITVNWLFLKIPVFDSSKEKTDKKKKDKKKKDKKKEETKEETPKEDKKEESEGGNGLIKQLYLDQGYDGLVRMINALGKSLSGFFGKIYKTFTIDELYITMVTAGSDAADTAIKYGKLCSVFYTVMGKLVSTCKVKKYDFNISPDFLAKKSKGEAYARFHVVPIRVTNAVVVLAFQLLFKVLFKVIFSKKKSDKSKEEARKVNTPESQTESAKNDEPVSAEGENKDITLNE